MIVDVETATEYYHRLPIHLQFPSYTPQYVVADASRDENILPVFFIYDDGRDFYYHAIHKMLLPNTVYSDIQSPYGYGGPVATTIDNEFLHHAWNNYCEWCSEQNLLVEFIRFHPVVSNQKYYLGEHCHDRNTVWIDLTIEDILASYSVRTRTAIRKALKNDLIVEWINGSDFLAVFPDLYRQTMNALQADDFYYFSDRYFQELMEIPNVRLAICRQEQEILACSIFLVSDYSVEYHLSAASNQGKKLCATNLLLHEAALLGKALGCKVLHLGGGTDARDDNPLLFFKSGFSKKLSDFNIGYYIHQPDIYEQMKVEWRLQYGEVNSRVLFYRF
jgi:hypothetical protein